MATITTQLLWEDLKSDIFIALLIINFLHYSYNSSFPKEYNDDGFNQFPIELSHGRLPESPNEVVLSEEIASNSNVDYKLGDSWLLEVGDRKSPTGDTILTQNDLLQIENGELLESLNIKQTKNYTMV